MNIFIMVLVFLFMAGYYFMDSPSQRMQNTEMETAITRSDLRSVAECAGFAQTATLKEYIFDDICLEQYDIKSRFICLNEKQSVVKCEIINKKKPKFSFMITTTMPIAEHDYNNMLEILEKYYPDSGTFGIFMDDMILGGGAHGKYSVPKSLVKAAELSPGQLVYMTQYEIPDIEVEYIAPAAAEIKCPIGSVTAYRFGRWQCIAHNAKTNCAGDKIWDSDIQECVPNNSRRPLCDSKQTAVMVEDVWQCLDPILEQECGPGLVARFNYNNLEWECIENPDSIRPASKCTSAKQGAVYGGLGATLRISSSFCTDCEEMVTNPETCATSCVPSEKKLGDPKCYSNTSGCTGSNRAFYFGFPSTAYAASVSAVSGYLVPLDKAHSQNRKFNCLDCGSGRIDTVRSKPPYIAVCE